MAEIAALSNKELRQKCIEYGMPNVPVTDSSRKLLIRRLEAAMSGKPVIKTPAKTNRRETMHVLKPTEVASSPKIAVNDNNAIKEKTQNRPSRRTIATGERHVTTTTTVSEPENSDVSPDRYDSMPIKGKINTPEKLGTLYPKLPIKEPSPKPQVLTKTGLVTTSYMQETTPINTTYVAPEDEIDTAKEFVEKEESIKQTVNVPSRISYVPVSEPKITTTAPLRSNLSSSTRYSSLDSYNSYNKSLEPKLNTATPLGSTLSSSTRYSSLNSYNYSKPSVLSTSDLRKSYIPPSGYSKKPEISSQYSNAYEAKIEDEEDYQDSEEEDDGEDVVLVEDSPIKDAETPYLSQFARNLENLKATPIRHSVGPTKITPPKSTLRNRDIYTRRTVGISSNVYPRRSIKSTDQGYDSSFRQLMMALEEKYHLKQSLILISIFIIAVFIYVFFIQSV